MKIVANFYSRFCVQPNDGFEQQLREFEAIYRARVEVAIEKKFCSFVCGWETFKLMAGCAKSWEWASSKEREGGGGCWWGEWGGQVQGGWQQSGLHGDLRLKKGGRYNLKIHSVSQCGERVRCKVFARYICDIRIVSSVKDWIQDLEQSPKDLSGPLIEPENKNCSITLHIIFSLN